MSKEKFMQVRNHSNRSNQRFGAIMLHNVSEIRKLKSFLSPVSNIVCRGYNNDWFILTEHGTPLERDLLERANRLREVKNATAVDGIYAIKQVQLASAEAKAKGLNMSFIYGVKETI